MLRPYTHAGSPFRRTSSITSPNRSISVSVVYTFGVTRTQLNSLCTIGVTMMRCVSHRCATSLFGSIPSIATLARPHDCRSEEHTSELQSQSNLVCRLLLEKKKKKTTLDTTYDTN